MHIPDGFIDGKTAAATAVLSVTGVGLALRRVRRELPPRRAPLLGLAAAFLFAAQMVNFPVAAGTSGHLIGGVLVASLLGPSAAVVVVTSVLIVQCFLFADGGVLALGANVFNMAIAGAGGGYIIYRLVCRLLPGERGQITAVAFAAWCSTVVAAVACAGELALSRTVPWTAAFPAMTAVHLFIGLGEGLISALVYFAVRQARPELIVETDIARASGQWKGFVAYGMLISLGIAVFVAPFACSWPDGLEFISRQLGFESKAATTHAAPMTDYSIPGVHWAVGATATAGAAGIVVVFALAMVLGRFLAPSKKVTNGNKSAAT